MNLYEKREKSQFKKLELISMEIENSFQESTSIVRKGKYILFPERKVFFTDTRSI